MKIASDCVLFESKKKKTDYWSWYFCIQLILLSITHNMLSMFNKI